MKPVPGVHFVHAANPGEQNPATCIHEPIRGDSMSSSKKQPAVRKAAKKIAAPRVVRSQDPATADSGKIRFGSGSAPASLRK